MTEERPRTWGAVAILLALTLTAYWGVLDCDFVSYDDDKYVTANPYLKDGLTAESLGWAFTSAGYQYNWHPLTWLSHMLDVQLFGLSPAGHHATNLVLHAAAVLLCFLALRRMTRAHWPAFFVAALFAVHPLRVESVAWVAERKDVLSGALFFLTLYAYARYVEERRPWQYVAFVGAFVLGLLAKPMLVTLPFLLLVLDYWPLRRKAPIGELLREKVPLVALALVSCVLTVMAQHAGGALGTFETLSVGDRAVNAVVSFGIYLGKTLWPAGLAVFHPHPALVAPEASRAVPLLASAAVLVAFTVIAVRERKRHPCYLTGWLWFLGMLVPVIGLVQVGDQAWAERYAYLPLVGIYVGGVYCLAGLAERGRKIALLVGALVLALCTVRAHLQVRVWRDSESLFRNALAQTERNYVAESNLGRVLGERGDLDAAQAHFEAAVEIAPGFHEGWFNLGKARYGQAQRVEDGEAARREYALAVEALERAVELGPENALARFNLAAAYAKVARLPEAVAELEEALRIQPDYPAARHALEQLGPMVEGLERREGDGS